MEKRVVITGLGAITPIGNDVEEFWKNIKEGKCGIDKITKFDTTDFKVKIAGEVKGYNPEDYFERREAKRLDLFSQYAIVASRQAWKDSGLDKEKENMERVGTIIGSGIGGIETIETEHEKCVNKGPDRVSPMYIPMGISNMATGNVAIDLGAKGESMAIVTACASGTHSIGEGYRMIRHGYQDIVIAGGTEASITPLSIAGFTNIKALTKEENTQRASIPFDKERSGFVMGEGAGVVVLEEYEHAIKRGAKIYGEVAGYGATCDAFHITSPAEDGEGAARAMMLAMEDGNVKPEQVEYINAHGTSTHHNDLFETMAIKKAFGDKAYDLNVNSTKSMVGHMLGAAGAVEFIVCIKSVMEDYIHKTAGFKVKDEELDLNYTPEAVNRKVNYAISNSLGFGGHNGSIMVKKFEA